MVDSQLFFEYLIFKERSFFLIKPENLEISTKLVKLVDDLFFLLNANVKKDIIYDFITIGFYTIAHSFHYFFIDYDYSVFSVDVFFTYFLEFLDDYFRKQSSILVYTN